MTKKRGGNNGARVYSPTWRGEWMAHGLMSQKERDETRQARQARLDRTRKLNLTCDNCRHVNAEGWRNCALCGWNKDGFIF